MLSEYLAGNRSKATAALFSVLLAAFACGPRLSAQTATTVAYTQVPGGPMYIASGPDNALWYAANDAGAIGRLTTVGAATLYPISGNATAFGGIALGPDNALWLTDQTLNKVYRFDPSAHSYKTYPIPTPNSKPGAIVAGPDGALWFAEGAGQIGRLSTAGSFTEYPLPIPFSAPSGIAAGQDGALWFTDSGGYIGRVTTEGVFKSYPVSVTQGTPCGVTSGPDGDLWFSNFANETTSAGIYTRGIGRITTSGAPTEFSFWSDDRDATYCTSAAETNGAVWFAQGSMLDSALDIRRVSTDGNKWTASASGSYESVVYSMAFGPDGRLWMVVTDCGLSICGTGHPRYVVRATISGFPAVSTASPLPAATAWQSYAQTQLSASGGAPPYTWTATGLPDGMLISRQGVLSGVPTKLGVFNAAITVTDSESPALASTKLFPMAVNSATPLSISTASLPAATVGRSYAAQLAASGGASPYKWSATGLPSGLSLSSSGALSGTPAAAGNYTSASFAVTDSSTPRQTATATLDIQVQQPPAAVLPVFSPAGGSFGSAQKVSISSTTPGAIVYYTTNGTTPTSASARYSSPIAVSQTTTIKAIAVASGYSNSAVASATYTIVSKVTAIPVITPGDGVYPSLQIVTIIDATPGAAITYTISDGYPPDSIPTPYAGPFLLKNAAVNSLSATATAPGFTTSAAASARYWFTSSPHVWTAPATNVGTSTATLNASITGDGDQITYWFVYGTSPSALTSATARKTLPEGWGVSAQLTGLKSKTAYYYQVIATHSSGTSSSATVSFTTK